MAMRAKTSFAGRSDQTKSPEEKPAVPREAITVQKKLEPGNLKPLTGAHDDVLSNVLCNQLLNAVWYHPSYEETDKDNLKKAALCAMEGLQPVTEGEGLLAAQMVACHWSAMECYRRAMLSNQTFEGTQQYLHLANKLSRTYAFLMEALDKHRGKGQQKVTVEHVQCASWWPSYRWHRGGGGGRRNTKDQAHAKALSHAPEPEMPSLLQENRQTVSERLDAERQVPYARRKSNRSTEGQ